jgi:hypothetical protein
VDVVVKGGVVAKDGAPAPVVSAQRR